MSKTFVHVYAVQKPAGHRFAGTTDYDSDNIESLLAEWWKQKVSAHTLLVISDKQHGPKRARVLRTKRQSARLSATQTEETL